MNGHRPQGHRTRLTGHLTPFTPLDLVLPHIIDASAPERFGMARNDLQNSWMFFLCSNNIGNFNELLRPLNTAQNRENTRVSR